MIVRKGSGWIRRENHRECDWMAASVQERGKKDRGESIHMMR